MRSKIVRFLYATMLNITEALETWIAVPRFHTTARSMLFSFFKSTGLDAALKTRTEDRIRAPNIVVTRAQSCADWFILKQILCDWYYGRSKVIG